MKNIINTLDIHTVNQLANERTGKFRFITKCRAGFMTIVEARDTDNEYYLAHPEALLTAYKKGALQTIEFQPEGSTNYFTVFAKKGNRVVIIDSLILAHLTVGTINQYWVNTNLYSQSQYAAVGAKTWADRAFVPYIVPVEA
jgi:hypothetical protein